MLFGNIFGPDLVLVVAQLHINLQKGTSQLIENIIYPGLWILVLYHHPIKIRHPQTTSFFFTKSRTILTYKASIVLERTFCLYTTLFRNSNTINRKEAAECLTLE